MKKYRFLALFLLLALLLSPAALALEDPAPQATAAILVDATYDSVLYELNAHEKRYPASITKVMTALLTLEAVDRGELALTDVITADPGITVDLTADGSSAGISVGEQMTVLDLLYCTLLPSANEACNILAYAVAGGVPEFVSLMNQRAAELGMDGTHFANAHGLHNDDHYTTAWDVVIMAREAMKHELFRQIVSTAEYTVPATNMSDERLFYNTNALLTAKKYSGYVYTPAIGIKTGSTEEAGLCLVSAAEEDGRTLYCVVLGAALARQEDDSYKRMQFVESARLLQWGFDNFSFRTILEGKDPVAELEVTLSDTDHVLVRPEGSLSALLPNDLDLDEFKQEVSLDAESVEAPVAEGQVLGKITLTYQGEEYGSLDLVALNDVERSDLLYYIDRVEYYAGNPLRLFSALRQADLWLQLLIAALGVLACALIVLLVLSLIRSRRRSRRRRRSRSYTGYTGRRRRR